MFYLCTKFYDLLSAYLVKATLATLSNKYAIPLYSSKNQSSQLDTLQILIQIVALKTVMSLNCN